MGKTRSILACERQSARTPGREGYCPALQQACVSNAGENYKYGSLQETKQTVVLYNKTL